MKVLNLYPGIGGNRKDWEDVEVTAVELNPDIAAVYQDFFPRDTVIVGDAMEYLLNHFKEYDFIWGSPPCPSHSRLNTFGVSNGTMELRYPDMSLYQVILLLKHWYKGKWVIENVIPYYKPLIPGVVVDRHLFWSNFNIGGFEPSNKKLPHKGAGAKYLREFLGFDLSKYPKLKNKRQILRNCVLPETGLYILNCARNIITKENINQVDMFD